MRLNDRSSTLKRMSALKDHEHRRGSPLTLDLRVYPAHLRPSLACCRTNLALPDMLADETPRDPNVR